MVPYYGDFPEDATVYIPFNTFDSNDPSASVTITDLADADIKVHKDGGIAQLVTDGATVAIDFDGITGNHIITIDTSVHADYSTGSEYQVRIEGATIDGATAGINVFIGSFSIERSGGVLALIKAGNLSANVQQVGGQTASATGAVDFDDLATIEGLASGATGFAAIDTVVDTILADTGTDGVVLSTATQQSIADTLLDRDMSTGTDSGSTTVRTVRQALRFLRNKWSISGSTLTVTKEDDATASWTAAVTTDAAADPITANDPAGP